MNYFTKDKRYNALTEYYKSKFNHKVAKINLNGSFTCPNRDGKKGYGGCTFCSSLGSGDFAGDKDKSILEQFIDIKTIIEKKWPDIYYIPYFQANSSTYKPLDELKKLYSEAIKAAGDKCVGLDIATRADAITDECIKYLGELNKTIPVTVELGLQTSNEKTGILINRCITNQEVIDCVKKLRCENIEVVIHIINGLPGEAKKDYLNTIDFVNSLDIQGIKLHSLLILKNTKMEEEYKNGLISPLSLSQYVDIVVDEICHLRDDIIIHRLSADGKIDDLIEPKWTIKKLVVMNEIDKKLRRENLYQGIYYKKKEI